MLDKIRIFIPIIHSTTHFFFIFSKGRLIFKNSYLIKKKKNYKQYCSNVFHFINVLLMTNKK